MALPATPSSNGLDRSSYPGDLPVRRGRPLIFRCRCPALSWVSARAAASVFEPAPAQRSGATGAGSCLFARAVRPGRAGLKTYRKSSQGPVERVV
jgi:hypothetical protein